MNSPTFITDISRQHIRIEGVDYSATEARTRQEGQPSILQETFYARYGADSFQASLADFLSEWFDDNDTVQVHTSGSTGTPKPMRVEKQRMMQSAMLTVSFLGLTPGDTALLCMPLKYIAGKMVVVRALVAGLNLLPVTPSGRPPQRTSTGTDKHCSCFRCHDSHAGIQHLASGRRKRIPSANPPPHHRRRSHRCVFGKATAVFSTRRMEHVWNDGNPVAHRFATSQRAGSLRLVHAFPTRQAVSFSGKYPDHPGPGCLPGHPDHQ